MINTVYQLVAPRRFEIKYSDIDLNNNKVIVRPTYLSICNADQRYYQGLRDAEILRKKLPMALIHEAIGEVVRDPSGNFKTGELVVMVPNTPVEEDDIIAENYLRSSKFRASGFDGFMQEYVEITPDRLVRLPQDIDRTVAAFTEIVSVSVHAIGRFDKIAHKRRNVIGIWGDGNLGYITAVFFKTMFPETKLYIFGVNPDKLQDFTFADATFTVEHIPEDVKIDMRLSVLVEQVQVKLLIRLLIILILKEQYQFLEYQSILYLLIQEWYLKRDLEFLEVAEVVWQTLKRQLHFTSLILK